MTLFYPETANNVHLVKLVERFGEISPNETTYPSDTTFVFLCFTNRSGSNLVAELISSSGKYNLAGEDLNWNTVVNHASRLKLTSFQEYFSWLSMERRKAGHFFVKVATSQIELLARAGILDNIMNRSKFLLLERNDKLGQAISSAIAFGSGRFTSWMKGSCLPEDVPFSSKQITAIIAGIAINYRDFDLFFANNGIVPISVVYEQLTDDPEYYISIIMKHLGLRDLQPNLERLSLERQSSHVNLEWRAKYLAGE